MKILAISGSLREESTNKTLLEAAVMLAPKGMGIALYQGIGQLPHFNPDLEAVPSSVVKIFKKRIKEADGLLISSPEYAHGVPGSLKNALDWLVGGTEIMGKPVALFDASLRSHYAKDSLVEILRTMAALVVSEAFAEVPFGGKKLTIGEIMADSRRADEIVRALTVFQLAIENAGRKTC